MVLQTNHLATRREASPPIDSLEAEVASWLNVDFDRRIDDIMLRIKNLRKPTLETSGVNTGVDEVAVISAELKAFANAVAEKKFVLSKAQAEKFANAQDLMIDFYRKILPPKSI
jgi:hypothetical protein